MFNKKKHTEHCCCEYTELHCSKLDPILTVHSFMYFCLLKYLVIDANSNQLFK